MVMGHKAKEQEVEVGRKPKKIGEKASIKSAIKN
jgi:hypothetical protein